MRNAHFGRERRLHDSRAFSNVFASAERSADRLFTVLARDNGAAGARLGLTVSRRAASRAVDRNRIKRIARETFRQLTLNSRDFVVMARPPAALAGRSELRRSLARHFRRIGESQPTGSRADA